MKRTFLVLPALLLLLPALPLHGGDEVPADPRLGKPKDYNGYFPWTPPKDLKEWEKRRAFVKARVQLANGLWPMPEKTPLKPVIHGQIERDGYTIEKVYFASLPGHYVTGNLYRPTGRSGKLAGVLCPHGHWGDRSNPKKNGRFYEASDKQVEADLKSGAEQTREGAKYPLQARCAQLARLGCVVFHYDMIGYADSTQILHPLTKMNPGGGFADAEAELWLQSFMGLQTWNSVRALDFLLSLPEVDASRIGVTGASGGGTQTFILSAIDERLTAAFPAVMVSTGMQGGCICENCTYLRVDTGNIELAGLFAPRPLAMSGANDWTKKIETDGLPQLKALYKLYGAEDKVDAKAWLQFGHNYNQVAREFMYNWFNKHLKLGHPEPVKEQPFKPVPPAELSVWDDQHQLPRDAVGVNGVRQYLTAQAKKQLQTLFPSKSSTRPEFSRVIGTALRVMINDELPHSSDVVASTASIHSLKQGDGIEPVVLTRKNVPGRVPAVWLRGGSKEAETVVWVHPEGIKGLYIDGHPAGGKLMPAARSILEAKKNILAIDVLLTGESTKEKRPALHKTYPGYTWGYNRPLLAERVRDILTAVAHAHGQTQTVHLLGVGEAGPWVALARPLCGDAVRRTAVDLNRFRFEEILSLHHDMMLPGALRYGGLATLVSLCAPHELLAHNARDVDPQGWLTAAYAAAGQASRLDLRMDSVPPAEAVRWLLRQ